MVAYAGEPNKEAIFRRLKKKNGLFNPTVKLDTKQVIDLRGELAKLMVPDGIRNRNAPLGLGDFVKQSSIRRPRNPR